MKSPTPPKSINGFKLGDIVYFNIAKRGSKSQALQFNGHGIGVFIGHVPPLGKDFEGAMAIMQLGRMGFIAFDDVAEFLSPEQVKTCIDRFDMKYFAVSDNAPKVIGIDGKPLEVKNEVDQK